MLYTVPRPNQALIITGAGAHKGKTGDVGGGEHVGMKIIVGKGVWVIPFFQQARRLGLQSHTTTIEDECVTKQGIPVGVSGVVVFKVGDDLKSIANAARRFLDNEAEMDDKVHNVFAGHLRSIIGGMTIEEIIGDRARLGEETRMSSENEMGKLGLIIDSLQIQEVDDPTDYITNLAAPHQAAVASAARIAKAARDQEATEKEQIANAAMAKARSESEVHQAELLAKSQEAQATQAMAGPRAAAMAKMGVVEQETKVSQLQSAQREQELQVEVVKPAQAARDAVIASAEADKKRVELAAAGEAAATQLRAVADAESTRVRGEAEGKAIKAKLVAEADGITARAAALASNQEAVINLSIAEQLPEIVKAAATSFQAIDNLTVLNGAEGVNDFMGQAVKAGLGLLPLIRESFNGENGSANGRSEHLVKPDEQQPVR